MNTGIFANAATEHVVFLLLTSYVDAHRHALPDRVKRFPIRGIRDVRERLHMLCDALDAMAVPRKKRREIEEATDVFGAATEQLLRLSHAAEMESVSAALWQPIGPQSIARTFPIQHSMAA